MGQVPGRGRVRGNHTLMLPSLSFSLPSPVKINKLNIFKKSAENLKQELVCCAQTMTGGRVSAAEWTKGRVMRKAAEGHIRALSVILGL